MYVPTCLNFLFVLGYFRTGKEVTAITSPGITVASPREGLPTELLPSGIYERKPQTFRKYLRRETDIGSLDFRQNPTQGRIAGRIVRISICSRWSICI